MICLSSYENQPIHSSFLLFSLPLCFVDLRNCMCMSSNLFVDTVLYIFSSSFTMSSLFKIFFSSLFDITCALQMNEMITNLDKAF